MLISRHSGSCNLLFVTLRRHAPPTQALFSSANVFFPDVTKLYLAILPNPPHRHTARLPRRPIQELGKPGNRNR
jgi:hypothetical protein